jgi:hypothetical protein
MLLAYLAGMVLAAGRATLYCAAVLDFTAQATLNH